MKLPEIHGELEKQRSDQTGPLIPKNFECWKFIIKYSSFGPYPKVAFENSLETGLIVKTLEYIRKISDNLKFTASINITEVGLTHAVKTAGFFKLQVLNVVCVKAQFHSISTGQVHTCCFLKLFRRCPSLMSPGLLNRTIKIFTTFKVMKQSDFRELCRIRGGCDLEELHTRMC